MKVNKEKTQQLIDYMKKREALYDQDRFFHDDPFCKSPACICGFGVIVFGIKPPKPANDSINLYAHGETGRIRQEVADALDISGKQSFLLFDAVPYGSYVPATFDEAIETLETLRDTGEVQWPRKHPHWKAARK